MSVPERDAAVPMAFVHHANQYLITDTYDNRQGINELVQGYAEALRLHELYQIPANLHLSGTLIEAVAWYCPWFLKFVRDLRAKGLVALIGGTYSENVMPLFDARFNIRQINEHLWLTRRHLGCNPSSIKICWIPERVWDTATLAPVLRSPELANDGFDYVLLDDRLLYPTHGQYQGSERAWFDSQGPYDRYQLIDGVYTERPFGTPDTAGTTGSFALTRIVGGAGLVMVPMSANLRYWLPPVFSDHWDSLARLITSRAAQPVPGLLVYADDLEKTAGVGGWDPGALQRYDAFLRWIAQQAGVAPVLLPDWLAQHAATHEAALDAGTFYELAQDWRAREDYQGWWASPTWAPYRGYLAAAQSALATAAVEGGTNGAMVLGWKHLMAATYETAWHDPTPGGRGPAPWARAVASHARTAHIMARAARWFAQPGRVPYSELVDVDDDGEVEAIIANDHLFAVLSAEQGGRISMLFARSAGDVALVIGNPSDDWNFQEQVNRYMDWPPNHPGALADVEAEHDRYQIVGSVMTPTWARIELLDIQPESRYYGLRKQLLVDSATAVLHVTYALPDDCPACETVACLSPDYYQLLREGRDGVQSFQGPHWRGWSRGSIAVWIGLDPAAPTTWSTPRRSEAGHGFNVGVQLAAPGAHFMIGHGPIDEVRWQQYLADYHGLSQPVSPAAPAVAEPVPGLAG